MVAPRRKLELEARISMSEQRAADLQTAQVLKIQGHESLYSIIIATETARCAPTVGR
jgi:hypothetical protein